MTLARQLLEWCDRPGGRSILARYASWHATRVLGRDVRVVYDGVWMHQIDGRFWADSPSFAYHRRIASKWLQSASHQDAMVRKVWFHVYQPRRGDVIVDVGAGDGSDLPMFSKAVGPSGRVVAIEAHPTTFAMMERVVVRNSLSNVTCVQKAIVDQPCTVHISDSEKHIANELQFVPDQSKASFAVQGQTLENICVELNLTHIDFLKMNIEGAERMAVQGMVSMMRRIRYLCVACHDFRANRGEGEQFRTRVGVIDFLEKNGCRVVLRNDATPDVNDHVHAEQRNTTLVG